MYHLIIDTCVWINLCKEFVEVRKKISDLVDQKKVRLILPQIVIDEWNRNKETKVIAPKQEAIRTNIKHAREISCHLEQDEAEKFKKILDGFQKQKKKIENLILQEITAVENLFNHPSTIKPSITENAISQAIEFALAKKAPFQNKNSMADALILFSSVDYVKQQGLANYLFISSNTEDFSALNKTQIHEDLQEIFDECGMSYFINIGQAINEIETNLVSDESISAIEEALQLEAMQRVLENYQQTMGYIKSMGDMSAIQDAIANQHQMKKEINEIFRSMEEFSASQEALANQWRDMEKIRWLMGNIPTINESEESDEEG